MGNSPYHSQPNTMTNQQSTNYKLRDRLQKKNIYSLFINKAESSKHNHMLRDAVSDVLDRSKALKF